MRPASLGPKPKRFIKLPTPPIRLKGLFLYFLPLSAVLATVIAFAKGSLLGIVVNAGAYALYLSAAILLRRGLAAEAEYHEKRISRAPRWPLKRFAAVLVAVATMGIAWLGAGYSLAVSAAFGAGALLGMYLSYGFDPSAEKIVAGAHGYSAAEVSDTIDAAERLISQIERANRRISNAEFNSRIGRICDAAREVLAIIEQDPGDIRRARKFLNVYLDGARKVTEGYANTHTGMASEVLEQNFRNLLVAIEDVFREQKVKLLENDVFDLDVQIEVLASQLKREGIL